MYLGICINNNDPERRGRVQVFIPQIMPALYQNWNSDGEDIEIDCIGDNMPQGLKSEVIDRLRRILPWAEAASPIVGTSSPGNVVSQMMEAVSSAVSSGAQAIASGAEAVAGAASEMAQQVGNVLDQSPAGAPVDIKDMTSLLTEAGKYAGKDERGAKVRATYFGNRGGSNCGRGSHGVLGALTGGAIKGGPLGGNANDFGARGRMDFTGSGLYNPKQPISSSYMNDPSQWKVGDVVANGGGREGYGHIQVWTGKAWVSDFTQNRILQYSNYHSFALHRPNGAGEAKINETVAKMMGLDPNATANPERPSISASPPSAPAQSQPTPPSFQAPPAPAASTAAAPAAAPASSGAQPPLPPSDPTTYGNVANQQVAEPAPPPLAGTTPPGSAEGGVPDASGFSNNEILFAMRIAATESGAGIQNRSYVVKEITNVPRAVGYSYGGTKHADSLGASKIAAGTVDWKKVDIGYCQSNTYDNERWVGKAVNSGSYANQIVGTAQLIRACCGKNSGSGSQVMQSIQSGNFGVADAIVGRAKGAPKSIGTAYFGLRNHPGQSGALVRRVNGEFGGDAKKAMLAINDQLPLLPTIEEMSNGRASIDPSKLAADPTLSPESKANYAATAENSTNMVQTTDTHGPLATQNLNGVAKGMFSFPAAGAMLWCFFREGNPQFPVYFAASYSQSEWSSVYNTGSPGPGYNPCPAPGEARSTGGMMNLNGVGGLRWEETHDPQDRSKDQKSIMLFGEDGSNVFMGKGYNQIYSRFDRRDQVEGDRWTTTLGAKENWTQGDVNDVTMGDVFIKIGNCSSVASKAVDKIHSILQEVQKPLQESSGGGGGGGGGGGSTGSPSPIKQDATLPPKLQEQIDKESILAKLAPDPGKFKYNPNISPAPVQSFSRASFITQQR